MDAPKLNERNQRESPAAGALQTPAADTDSGVSIARRRALLRGLGKGAALAGAATPLSGLATSGQRMKLIKTNGNVVLCSVSGNMSVLVSASATSLPQCTGSQLGSYQSALARSPVKIALALRTYPTWPGGKLPGGAYCMFGSVKRMASATFYDCFGSGSKVAIGDIVDLSSPTDESYWVMAVLNANITAKYPYSADDVVKQYQNATKRSASLSFHKTVAGYA